MKYVTVQKMKFSVKDFSSKYDQSRSFPRICSQLLKKSLTENFIFCAVCTKPNNAGPACTHMYAFGLQNVFGPLPHVRSVHNFFANPSATT